ncbi:hypothetical protein BN7_6494 [Wickerhamomyces ciferrii]|uniref:Uncharacterized protein n=1 Tax=Wickerhamomyces ciferrii (strain ATCC 14091 / BCRC 22168 / CBS 111 / JCM 3599 / NBRC 0793 / NRRL Y-1031 F-60-10) TaxID=1206466 RepID=K0KUM4_WICCF|nr:uncharacterized protein BN7_6494 [Wickerhamomyces ciferrii]CCH46891.1 hypothetical protein BN7_6494 [Wickerhamomyces ciferrii]
MIEDHPVNMALGFKSKVGPDDIKTEFQLINWNSIVSLAFQFQTDNHLLFMMQDALINFEMLMSTNP